MPIPPNTITTTMSNQLNLPHNLQVICIDEIPDDSVFDDSGLIEVSVDIDVKPSERSTIVSHLYSK